MGTWNTYGHVELKVNPHCRGIHYGVGSPVDIPDGVYLGLEGVAVVQKGLLSRVQHTVTDKWGQEHIPGILIEEHSPMLKAVRDVVLQHETKWSKLSQKIANRLKDEGVPSLVNAKKIVEEALIEHFELDKNERNPNPA